MDPCSFDPPDLTVLADRVAYRDFRGCRKFRFRYLLDGRLFHLFCRPGPTDALDGFCASLKRHRLTQGELPDLEMTPLAILDSLGVEPPQYRSFPFSKSSTQALAIEIATVLLKMIKEDFGKLPELQASNLRQRVDELRSRQDSSTHELFDLCLSRVVSREGFEDSMLYQLAVDAFLRFRFPEEHREEISRLCNGLLLSHEATASGLSKVRLLKVLWDRSYARIIKKHPQARAEIQAVDQEIKPRTYQDFLGWEVIHYAILGYPGKRMQPVIAFTPDSEAVLKTRCRAHKTALRAFLDQIPSEELATRFRLQMKAWRPGWLVPCRTDGTFNSSVSTGELPIF